MVTIVSLVDLKWRMVRAGALYRKVSDINCGNYGEIDKCIHQKQKLLKYTYWHLCFSADLAHQHIYGLCKTMGVLFQ